MSRRVLSGSGLNPAQVQALIDAGSFATSDDIDAAISALVNTAPEALDTLFELAAALDNDPNFAENVLGIIGGKADVGHNHDGTYAAASHNHDSTYAAKSTAFVVVTHGSTASTARPTGVGAVYWVGSVEPNNAVNTDLWYDTTGDA
jgi:hypothetical protein